MGYKCNKHGTAPFRVAVVHGGPGAAGSAAPLARGLAGQFGVLEPIQTVDSVDGQVAELKETLSDNLTQLAVLIGWSWGAWLALIVAARNPGLVMKLILVSSPPFEARYSMGLMETRLNRLSESEGSVAKDLMERMGDPSSPGLSAILARFGELMTKSDTFDLIEHTDESPDVNFEIYQKVWAEAAAMRKSGKLLNLAEKIECPVVALHGDYDPHPAEGVKEPLGKVLSDFRSIKLAKCGHSPWHERQARERFFQILTAEISTTLTGTQ